MAGRQWHLDGGWVAMFIIGGLIVPRSLVRGWGCALDRDVCGFHFRWKWKPVRWSWGIGGYGVNSLTNPVHRFWSFGGGGTGGKCLRMTNTI